MHMTMIQFKLFGKTDYTDICIVRSKGEARKYTEFLKAKYPSYECGEFAYKKIKFIKSVPVC